MASTYSKALQILEKILEGKTPKQIAYECDTTPSRITEVKKMFPLFTGLTNKYSHHEE